MLYADISSVRIPTQAYNKADRGFNSAGNSVSTCFIKSQDILTFNLRNYSVDTSLGLIKLISHKCSSRW